MRRTRLTFCALVATLIAAAGAAAGGDTVDEFAAALQGKLHYNDARTALCTHYSHIGVTKTERLGMEGVWIYYNRKRTEVSPALLTIRIAAPAGQISAPRTREETPLSITETADAVTGTLLFAATDALQYTLRTDHPYTAELLIPKTGDEVRNVSYEPRSRMVIVRTEFPRSDGRDPAPTFPVAVALALPEGVTGIQVFTESRVQPRPVGEPFEDRHAEEVRLLLTGTPQAGEANFHCAIAMGDQVGDVLRMLDRARGQNLATSLAKSREWLSQALGSFSFDNVPDALRPAYASAVKALLFNTKAPHGKFGNNLACFPNRGTYCTHYNWDSCFQAVGLAHFNPKIAADGLRILVENQEADGKIPQFVCATWNRPGGAQPPLIAWAAWRLYEKTRDRKILDDIYQPVARNVDWWFAKRDPDQDGLVEYSEPVESGWDDSPRFDEGTIEGVDLNAYLVREMRILGDIAQLRGNEPEAKRWRDRAEALAKRIVDFMYDREANIFRDLRAPTNKFITVLTPASLMPLWVGVPIPEDKARAMIERHLLDPNQFFGPYPFPVVAYNDPKYNASKWWRGPMWPNIAWAMTEVLAKYGYKAQQREAINHLTGMMAKNDEIYELYNSQTGGPLGSPDQGWSCAVFVDWVQTLARG
ncbi:hypothetical protein AMK68_02980 [candidate division KD3-62 bacterium DG_56]|uniref:Mannosylglycerate hydrolase MGH1-like glycoside hydrolase domain-containing protein n=1 Tax=candidate division KD3-62 bacterium DG_56 TaxID=1704032 RepID=A0A0S7XMZ2_9BACT|nr:MAG: hypothetical protein AMK68_02980 [candidate division KD3-62 bacterium DG_56]